MKYIITISLLFIVSCNESTPIYEYNYTHEVPDSLMDDFRDDFISIVDVDEVNLSGDPDYDDDIEEIFYRLKDTYKVKVHRLKVIENSSIRYINEYEIGDKLKPMLDSLKQKYYGVN